MNPYRRIFSDRKTLLAVIHVEGGKQGLRNAKIAREEGVDGIFLINHRIPYISLLECYEYIHEQLPDLWIGLNCLELGRAAVDVIPEKTSGLWIDNADILEECSKQISAKSFSKRRKMSDWRGIYFGGVAFKYQSAVSDVGKAARNAIPFVDVITTSGYGTGIAADVDKIRRMKGSIGDHPLAIASGITPENVSEYMPYADCFLVATGISDSHTELNPSRVRKLVKALRN